MSKVPDHANCGVTELHELVAAETDYIVTVGTGVVTRPRGPKFGPNGKAAGVARSIGYYQRLTDQEPAGLT